MTDPWSTTPPPGGSTGSTTGSTTGGTSGTSTTDTAKSEASDVAAHAKGEAGAVAAHAKDQAAQVASEAAQQTRNLASEAVGQIQQQAQSQQSNLATQLRSISSELSTMASNTEQSGPAATLVSQASQQVDKVASWLDERDPQSVLDEFRDLARRRPGAFLAGAAVAGVIAGRLTRAGVSLRQDDSSTSTGSTYPAAAPVVADYSATDYSTTDYPVTDYPVTDYPETSTTVTSTTVTTGADDDLYNRPTLDSDVDRGIR